MEEWISIKEKPHPENLDEDYLICTEDEEGTRDIYKGFFSDGEWWTQWLCGCKKISEEKLPHKVVAWKPLPENYTDDILSSRTDLKKSALKKEAEIMDDEKQKYVVVNEHDGGGVFCFGVYDDYDKALGVVMRNIWDFKESYKDDGDTFEISAPYPLEGDGGYGIAVTYKAKSWEKPYKDYYFILYTEDE